MNNTTDAAAIIAWIRENLQETTTMIKEDSKVYSDVCFRSCQESLDGVAKVNKTSFGRLLRQLFKVNITKRARQRPLRYFYKGIMWKGTCTIPVGPEPTEDDMSPEIEDLRMDVQAGEDLIQIEESRTTPREEYTELTSRIAELELKLTSKTIEANDLESKLEYAIGKIEHLRKNLAFEREEKNSLYCQLSSLQPLPQPSDLQTFTTTDLSDFETPVGTLGEGSFGSVTAFTSSTGEGIAVKVMQDSEELTREAICLLHVRDIRNIQQLVAIPATTTLVTDFIHMETSRRSSLERVLRHQDFYKLSHDDFLCQCQCLTSALKEIHMRGMTHNDIKPNNYILINNTRGKLIDFGLASSLKEPMYFQEGLSRDRDWIAPEISDGSSSSSIQSDIFSIGSIFRRLRDTAGVRGLSAIIASCHRTDPRDRPSILLIMDILAKCRVSLG